MSVTMEEKSTTSTVQPFGIVADHPRMCDLLLQGIPACRLRSTIRVDKPSKDQKSGIERVSPDQAKGLGQFPSIPGMELHVNPAKLSYTVIDPLHEDEEMCKRIKRAIDNSSNVRTTGDIAGVPPLSGTLDPHRMKTLCREILWLAKAGDVKVCKGSLPSMADVEKMNGEFMLNPGSMVQNMQPRYERDWPAYLEQLSRVGG